MFIIDLSEDKKIHPTPQNTPAKTKNNQKKPAPPDNHTEMRDQHPTLELSDFSVYPLSVLLDS